MGCLHTECRRPHPRQVKHHPLLPTLLIPILTGVDLYSHLLHICTILVKSIDIQLFMDNQDTLLLTWEHIHRLLQASILLRWLIPLLLVHIQYLQLLTMPRYLHQRLLVVIRHFRHQLLLYPPPQLLSARPLQPVLNPMLFSTQHTGVPRQLQPKTCEREMIMHISYRRL
ncbi:hypothetical protein BDQ17DRAFT_410461 [Cyathus striatus]|nr:hypothetical protein BDQ17DRAFT_410461 [Cyathus striatus]